MSAIGVENVWKEYAGVVVLERIQMEIETGAFVALVGPSGCGKTTFLRMLLGMEVPTTGRILIDGTALSPEPGPDRGVVFQRYSVFPHLRALENVMLGIEMRTAPLLGKLFGSARRRAREESAAMLEQVGLGHALTKYPAELSGGMQQRLALAQALIRRPKVLLLDEPFGALDPGIRGDMQALLAGIWAEHGLTVVMVTHDLSEAFRLATRVIAFERPRDRPEERERYGATITRDLAVWPDKRGNRVAAPPVATPEPTLLAAAAATALRVAAPPFLAGAHGAV
ncbi:ABC transporter ATP-binding protein [Zavarzinia sp. CC-PAN008]|uniref:ABC transporter ATP-binding protein n=1 Tax=Zavarzinia sp. CC-PAN008 TaxID=3243332 RepID=UPI003F74A448